MALKHLLFGLCVVGIVAVVGCSKSEDSSAAPQPGATNTADTPDPAKGDRGTNDMPGGGPTTGK